MLGLVNVSLALRRRYFAAPESSLAAERAGAA